MPQGRPQRQPRGFRLGWRLGRGLGARVGHCYAPNDGERSAPLSAPMGQPNGAGQSDGGPLLTPPRHVRARQGHTAQVLSLDVLFSVPWTEDRCQTLTGSADFTARIWDLRTGKARAVLEGHMGWVRCVCLTPDGEVAVTGSNDCSVRVWECQEGECLHTLLGHSGPVNAVQVKEISAPLARLATH